MRSFFFSLHFELIDVSLQVAGLGAGPVGVPATLLRAQPELLAPRLGAQSSSRKAIGD